MKVRVLRPVSFAPPAILKLTAAQAAARRPVLRKVSGGHELLAPVQFKAGEVLEIKAIPKALADSLRALDDPPSDVAP